MNEIYEDAINYLKYYGEKNDEKIERISYFLEKELKNYIQLQSNWNSLRECIIGVIDGAGEELNTIRQGDDLEYINKCTLQYEAIRKNLEIVLDKMNELESGDNK